MAESPPERKRDEQFPLLMVAGAGDGSAPPRPRFTTLWSLSSRCSSAAKRSLLDRFPEYLSTCWMTFILLGVSFLVFYAIGMVAFRHQTYIVLKCNNESKPGTDVFFHHMVPHGALVPFMIYSDYLGTMATQYPNLRINVVFLINDYYPLNYGYRRSKFDRSFSYKLYEEFNKREIREFQKRYTNMNMTVISLSKYMALTPLRYLWRTVPIDYIPFYARVYSVWQHGGLAFDLSTSYTSFMTGKFDRKITDLLRLHNDGVKPEGFDELLSKIGEDERMFMMFYTLLSNLLQETKSVMSNIMPVDLPLNDGKGNDTANGSLDTTTSLIDTLLGDDMTRVKRQASDKRIKLPNNNTVTALFKVLQKPRNGSHDNVTKAIDNDMPFVPTAANLTGIASEATITAYTAHLNSTKQDESTVAISKENNTSIPPDLIAVKMWKENEDRKSPVNKSELPQFVLIYDVMISQNLLKREKKVEDVPDIDDESALMRKRKAVTKPAHRVFVNSDGSFISATTQFHPFLSQILAAGCKRMPPKLAIKEALFKECASIYLVDKIYCNSIYVF